MYPKPLLWLCLFLALSAARAEAAQPATTESTAQEPEAKHLSGMSIIGNDEAPKALFIVPWKKSEIGAETDLNMMLTESAVPVDREVFIRQLDLFESRAKK